MSYNPDVVPGNATVTINGDTETVVSNPTYTVGPIAAFIQTAAGTPVVGTDPQTSIVGTGLGSMTIPANTLTDGSTIRLSMNGVFSTGAVIAPTINFTVYIGPNSWNTGSIPVLVSANKRGFYINQIITVYDEAAGTAQPSGTALMVINATSGLLNSGDLNNAGGVESSINFAASQLIDITATWGGGANGTCTINSITCTMEILNIA